MLFARQRKRLAKLPARMTLIWTEGKPPPEQLFRARPGSVRLCMCVCARPVVCLPMYGGERGGGNRFYFLFFSRHPLLAFCLEQVEHGSANNVACGFISEKVIEIPRARVGN